jgi:hypothetical protein
LSLGATPAEWAHFADVLGLRNDLFPCVPYSADVSVYPGSRIEGKVGKIPSVFTWDGYAVGLASWTTRKVQPEELIEWSKDSRYNLCVRTGVSGVYAFDVDVTDKQLADKVEQLLIDMWPSEQDFAWRVRDNSSKFLLAFRMDGEWTKRYFKTNADPLNKDRIELLGIGQQFVACGTHSSGSRLVWNGGLLTSLPTLSPAQAEEIWNALSARFAVTKTPENWLNSKPTSELTMADTELRTSISDDDWTKLGKALISLQESASDNDRWSEIGYALLSLQATRPVKALWLEFSQEAPNYEPGAPESWWSAHEDQVPRSDYRHIFSLARFSGWRDLLDPGAFPLQHDTEVGGEQGASGSSVHAPEPVQSATDAAIDLTPALPERPIFRIEGGNLPHLIDKAQKLLAPVLYANGSTLVRVEDNRMATVSASWVNDQLGRLGHWERFDHRTKSWEPCDCPTDFSNKFQALGVWPLVNRIDAIASAPFIRDDGSICDVPGYDGRSKTLYQPTDKFPHVPERPTYTDARFALQRLLAPFDEFPLVGENSRSTFIAHILTEASRLSVDTTPMFWYSAGKSGSGKTLLAEIASRIVHGSYSTRTWPKEGDEMRKVMYTALLAGERHVTFDNLSTGFKARSPELCAILTSDWWTDRKLGVSEGRAVRNKAVLTATGNNVTPVGDLARRSLVVRIAFGGKDRVFKITDLKSYVREHRPQLLVDALIILRAWRETNDNIPYPILPSFEQWSREVLGALIWLGMENPLTTQKDETDDESDLPTDTFLILGPTMNGRPFVAADVSQLAGVDEKLNKALIESGCDEPYRSRSVGYWLRDMRDNTGGGWQLVQDGSTHGHQRWRLIRIDNEDLI